MKKLSLNNWIKNTAIALIALLTPTLTLAEDAVVASAANPIPTVISVSSDYKLPAKQIDIATAIPLGPIPAERLGGDNKMVTPAPVVADDADTEEVEVTAENESEEGFPVLAAIPIAIAINALLSFVIFAGVPF